MRGGYRKEYTSPQLCFPYPLVAFAWCGNKAAAFWALLLRDSIHSPEQHNTRRHSARGAGGPALRRSSRVHRRGQCSLSLPWTQKRQRERFDCGRLAGVPRRRPLYPSLGRRLPIHLLLVPALEFRDAVRYFTRTVLFINNLLASAARPASLLSIFFLSP